jgi:spermidine dehydrogenase
MGADMSRLKSAITRRDFMNGVAWGLAGAALPALPGCARRPAGYPPIETGLRGAHAGAFEVAHAVAWENRQWPTPDTLTDHEYDLIVIGAGLCGLATAFHFRERAGPRSRILILDNHDDFGGHAKRNEFEVDGKRLIGHGGSQSIDTPSAYSPQAKALLAAIGVDVARFYEFFDQEFYARRGMRSGIYFDAKTYRADVLADLPIRYWTDAPDRAAVERALAASPLALETKSALLRLSFDSADPLPGLAPPQKVAYLRKLSFEEFLRRHRAAPEELILLLRRVPLGIWGVGWDALSALEGARWGMPGASGLGIKQALADSGKDEEPYIFHFPDGNASLARLLVRKLRPDVVSGSSMEDVVGARVRYERLDDGDAAVRIRLNATAVDIRHANGGAALDVVYVKEGAAHRVRGQGAVMAGYMGMLPYICREVPPRQQEAIRFFTKVPLVYVNVALRQWRAFADAGFHRVYSPAAFFDLAMLDFPVSLGGYRFAASPDEPILAHLQHVPAEPGLDEKDQHRAGRHKLYALTYDDFEQAVVGQLDGMLAAQGFDAERDIAAITVNRWPHGYAYEYNELYDPPDWTPQNGPHLTARAKIGRLSIANADSSAYAYVDGAFDAAIRAVDERLA